MQKYCLFFMLFFLFTIPDWSAEIKKDLPKPDYEQVQKTIRYLAEEIGPRPAGSEHATQVIQYISDKIKQLGYNYTYQDYKLPDNRNCRTIHAYYAGTSQHEIILAAHIDTVPECPGANDDGSGVAVLLELARIVRGHHVPVGIHFIFLGAEEMISGYDEGRFYSSAQYIEYQKNLGLDFLNGVIILDKVGVGEIFQVLQMDSTKNNLTDKLVVVANQMKLPLERRVVKRWQPSMPFEDAGLATVWLEWGPDPNLHSSKDTINKISRKKIESVLTLMEQFIFSVP